MKQNIKMKITTTIAVFAIVLSVLAPLNSVFADDSSDRQKVESALNEYGEDAKSTSDILTKFEKEDLKEAQSNRNSISYVLYRTFIPQYINNLESGILAEGLEDPRYDGKHVCDPSAPNNLLNHNCNVPNFAAELVQNVAQIGSGSGLSGASITSAKSPFGIGVPKDIPGGVVPVDPVKRTSTYTPLELYGYDLPLSTYNGEWDKINKSTEARLLSNFGAMEKVTMVGKSLWNGVKAGLGATIDGFSFNPLRWATNVFSATSGGTMISIVDTSELNIIATDGWNRNGFNNTLYNVYVLTDNEVARESAMRYMRTYMNKLNQKADASPELQEVMALETPPNFEYDPLRESDKSKEERERVMAENIKIAEEAAKKDKKPKLKKVPEPVMMTEKEQLDEWIEENEDILNRGKKQGLIETSVKGIEDYKKFVEDWNEKWEAYSKREFAASGLVVTDILEEIDKDLVTNDYYSDPKQPISHYVCANSSGVPMRKSDGSFEYLYTAKNNGETESLNPKCSAVRPPIGGGLLGDGWHINREKDTRHIANFDSSKSGPLSLSKHATNLFASINKTLAKMTNSILNLSFAPILTYIGVTDIITALMESFRDTMFFPLAGIFVAVGAFIMFAELLRNRSAITMLRSIVITFIIFVVSSMILLRPELVVRYIEEVPTKVDNLIADIMLQDYGEEGICATGSKGDGIRAAQCNVWNISVFRPWVQAQFGTSYDNLYAKGFGENGKTFNNKNEDLVGDASVHLGGGKVENNWALYHLDKIKSGTITSKDNSRPLGITDPNMYKLIDLQAGPNNGALSDDTYFRNWTGEAGGRFYSVFAATLQSVLVAAAVISLGFIKIEQSIFLSFGFLFIPIIALSGVTEKGRSKFGNHILRLFSFFMKRVVVTIMLTLLLRIMNMAYAPGISYTTSVIGSSAIMGAFLMYKRELLELFAVQGNAGLSAGDPEAIRNAIDNATPRYVKNKAARAKSRLRGKAAGAAGGALGGLSVNHEINKHNKLREEIGKKIYGDEYNAEDDNLIIDKRNNLAKNVYVGASTGADETSRMSGRQAERVIRRSGFSVGEIYSASGRTVVEHGIESITNNEETLEAETLKQLLHESKKGESYNALNAKLSDKDKSILYDKKVQKLVREEADKKRETLELHGQKEVPIAVDISEAVDLIDKRKDIQLAKDIVKQPLKGRRMVQDASNVEKEKLRKRLNPGGISNAEEIRKQIIRNRESAKDKGGEDNEE